ncbi:MAG: hypothetical protein OXN27_12835 [Candidatus Poribacteria bacterium]|nr:hypothetical protein [Candidatus Poribacteria bacterium]
MFIKFILLVGRLPHKYVVANEIRFGEFKTRGIEALINQLRIIVTVI